MRIKWFGIKRNGHDPHKEAIETGTLLGRLESVTDRLDKLVEQLEKMSDSQDEPE